MSDDQSREDIPQTREERVRACMALMPHQWIRGGKDGTSRRLAREWGCNHAVVEQASAEAWRRLNAQDVTWVREHLCNELLGALEDAKTIDEVKDRVHSIVEVSKAWAPLVGVAPPAKSEVAVKLSTGASQWDAARSGDEAAQLEVATVLAAEVASFCSEARRVLLEALTRPMLVESVEVRDDR